MSKITKSQFSRVYKRESKSIFDDSSTLLILADVISAADESIVLGYENYIYLHRHANGEILGASISKQLLKETPELEQTSRYVSDIEMYALLLLHLDKIKIFCDFFADEFFNMFLLPPNVYFEHAERVWLDYIDK